MTQTTFLILVFVFGMGAFYYEKGSPAQIILGILAGLCLLINNNQLPFVSQFLAVNEQPIPTVSLAPPVQPLPELPQSPTREDFVNLIMAVQQNENAQHIDTDFLIAIASAESSWNPNGTDNNTVLTQLKEFAGKFDGFKARFLSECNGCMGTHFHIEFNSNKNADAFLKYINKTSGQKKEVAI